MMSICARYKSNKDDAVYLLNTAFIKIMDGLPSFDCSKALQPWIKTIVVRVAIDDHRKNKSYHHHVVLTDQNNWLHEAHSTDLHGNQLEVDDYWSMFNALPEPEKTVFNLFAIDGYSHKEISKELNISERSSKRYLSNARQLLAEQLSKTELMEKGA